MSPCARPTSASAKHDLISDKKRAVSAKRRRGLGTGPQAGLGGSPSRGLVTAVPIVPHREAIKEKSSQGAKRYLTVGDRADWFIPDQYGMRKRGPGTSSPDPFFASRLWLAFIWEKLHPHRNRLVFAKLRLASARKQTLVTAAPTAIAATI